MNRKAKIIATIGPSSSERETLSELIDAGMDVARLNFSHGTHDDYAKIIRTLRELGHEKRKPLAILQDLQGPKLRTGETENGQPVLLTAGNQVTLTTKESTTTNKRIFVDYEPLTQDVKPGDRILLDDGSIELKVIEARPDEVQASIIVGGILGPRKGINLPGVDLSAPSMTEKDFEDLAFGIEHGVDAVALSFVRKSADIQTLQEGIDRLLNEARKPLVIAKLERPEAIENLEGILDRVDGVMVARGDLGVEVSPERVPSIQKKIIYLASERQRFVITATQMLESMIHNARPTRAEASDVANAVFDGSDVLMLSGETAVGDYPIQSVQTMTRIIMDAEAHSSEWGHQHKNGAVKTEDDAVAVTHAARSLAHDRSVSAISVFTRSGRTGRLMSIARPQVPILAFTPEEKTYHQLAFCWGVLPHLVEMSSTVEEMIEHVQRACLESEFILPGEQVVMVASLPVGEMGPPNFALLQTVRSS
ncbi:MAG: pyruvate kinase [Anaerolineales bacterium]|jgi:pyruvate kinase